MRLQQLTIRGIGPFGADTVLNVDENVTVLTGSNDAGKSALLNGLEQLYRQGPELQEPDVNADHRRATKTNWKEDRTIGCTAVFVPTSAKRYVTGGPLSSPDDQLFVEATFAPAARTRAITKRLRGKGSVTPPGRLADFPTFIKIANDSVRNEIPLAQPTPIESRLLQIAFGAGFSAENIGSLSSLSFSTEVDVAGRKITDRLREVMPPTMDLSLRFIPIAGQQDKLGVLLTDRFNGYTPIGSRGAGVQRMLAVLVGLMGLDFSDIQAHIVLGEPEVSLHADAQHSLRTFLEDLAQRDTVQVVYATHSPAMVNTLRPESVRLVQRDNQGGRPTTVVENRPTKGNFAAIRSSLGMSPADSLLYGPVTIIVEGESEVLGLPAAIAKLQAASVHGFERADRLLSQCHILDGMGDTFEMLCRFAKSQGSRPIVFVDGDKIRRVKQQDFNAKHKDVPVIHLNELEEFEDLVDRGVYFEALAAVLALPAERCNAAAFAAWRAAAPLSDRMLFTKQVGRWLDEIAESVTYRKPVVVREAIAKATAEQIQPDKLRALLEAIERQLVPA